MVHKLSSNSLHELLAVVVVVSFYAAWLADCSTPMQIVQDVSWLVQFHRHQYGDRILGTPCSSLWTMKSAPRSLQRQTLEANVTIEE
jgi:hypothetical protein